MLENDRIWVAQSGVSSALLLNKANRHGLIAGASGTGKTVTVKVLVEGFSQAGVPTFIADVKGDVIGVAQTADDPAIKARAEELGALEWNPAACPVHLWSMPGSNGIPVRITVSDMGPELLSRLLGLTDVQAGVLKVVFRVADDNNMLLIDLKDLRAMLTYVGEHAKDYELTYGKVSTQSVSAILRALLAVEDQGGADFFGEPDLDLSSWFCTDATGAGIVNVLDARTLIQAPQVYAMFLLWMLTELFETLPEAGDLDRPKFVFFFDEAHLLFEGMPKALVAKIVQVVKLVRSKGVGIYFISQSPSDIPDDVLAQLSNRIQHGLRAYTPAEQKAVRAAARAFRENPAFNSEEALKELATGEALVSFLDEKGAPSVVERARVLPPECLMGAPSQETIDAVLAGQAELMQTYGAAVDRESAFELLDQQRAQAAEADRLAAERAAFEAEKAAFEAKQAKEAQRAAAQAEKERLAAEREQARQRERAEREEAKQKERMAKTVNSVLGQIGREASRQLMRGLFGSLKR